MPDDIDPRLTRGLEEELARRKKLSGTKVDLSAYSFPEQAKFINDPSTRKAALCTRRAGKTVATAIMLVNTALAHANTVSLFLSYTRQTAIDTIQTDLERFLRVSNVTFEFNKSNLTFRLPNGSRIILRGADKTDELKKYRGQKYRLVVIDECGHGTYANILEPLLKETIFPTVADYNGTVVLIGTPSESTNPFFKQVTTGAKPGWSVHKWSYLDNPHIRDNMAAMLAQELASDPEYLHTDGYKREYLGQWERNNGTVYRFDPAKNLIAALPIGAYRRILSVDLGWNDATAFVIAAINPQEPTLYIEHSEKHQRLDYLEVANRSKELATKYGVSAYVIDGAVRQAVETIRNRYNIPFVATQKSPNYKYNAIQIMNGDFGAKRVLLIAGANSQLIEEYDNLYWDQKQPTREDQQAKNDLCDAALYAHIRAKAWNVQAPEEDDNPYPDEGPRYRPLTLNDDSTLDLFDYLDITESLK